MICIMLLACLVVGRLASLPMQHERYGPSWQVVGGQPAGAWLSEPESPSGDGLKEVSPFPLLLASLLLASLFLLQALASGRALRSVASSARGCGGSGATGPPRS